MILNRLLSQQVGGRIAGPSELMGLGGQFLPPPRILAEIEAKPSA